MKKTSVVPVVVQRVDHGASLAAQPDLLAVEEPLEIRLGFGAPGYRDQRALSVTMRTPGHDMELVLGFLLGEGIIQRYDQVESIHYCAQVTHAEEQENVVRVELAAGVVLDWEKMQRNFYVTSSCGVCGKSSIEAVQAVCTALAPDELSIPVDIIQELPGQLTQHQAVFNHTGGLHAVALFDCHGVVKMVREDVGRHNAFDKVVGASLMQQELPLSNAIVLVSGRASFELVQKAIMAGIPILAAVGAPSSLAVDLAKQYGITLLGFVRDGRFNVYSGGQRLRFTTKEMV
jgi:FdhD protein